MANKKTLKQAAEDAVNGFFMNPPTTEEKEMKQEKKAEKPKVAKSKKKVFAFRATEENMRAWKAYATATGRTMEEIGAAAMQEYIEAHKPLKAEKDIFELLKNKGE